MFSTSCVLVPPNPNTKTRILKTRILKTQMSQSKDIHQQIQEQFNIIRSEMEKQVKVVGKYETLVRNLKSTVAQKDSTLTTKDLIIQRQDKQIATLLETIARKDSLLAEKDAIIAQKTNTIELLKKSN